MMTQHQKAVFEPVRISNRRGRSPYVLVCDHASNFIPSSYASLGLTPADLIRHIAWDPGALPIAARMAERLDAVLVESCVSRLMIDCNRPLDAPDLIPAISEATAIPGNAEMSAVEREARVGLSWTPFHEAVDDVVAERVGQGLETRLVSIHSFNPVYRGVVRPWEIGIIHDDDTRIAAPLIDVLRRQPGLTVGINQPYSPADRVYYTLERHGRSRGLACAMIEIRNDEIARADGQAKWAELLSGIFADLKPAGVASGPAARPKTKQMGQATRQ